jgi:hypothetical protein
LRKEREAELMQQLSQKAQEDLKAKLALEEK